MNKGLIDGTLISRSYITPQQYNILLMGNQLRLLGSTGLKDSTSAGPGYYSGTTNKTNLDPESAIFLNSYLPHRLTKLADKIKAKLIHI